MPKKTVLRCFLFGTAAALVAQAAPAATFNIPPGSLEAALDAYSAQTGVSVVVANKEIQGIQTRGAAGNLSVNEALAHLLKGTGFVEKRDSSGTIGIVRGGQSSSIDEIQPLRLAQASQPTRAAVETVTVTSSKLGGADVQSIPIAITALSQEQLTATQTAGGPDLVKQVPNLTFSKTNFTGYNIQIRGIGTQAISVTTDPAVAVALNDIPFIRNHFFEQEFFDVSQVEILRGPQGTLYGRNATAGVVNLTSAKPTDQFEAMGSAEIGSYHQRRVEGMLNIPIVDDEVDIRLAGEWTKRQGYSFNELTDKRIDGRDLWSSRVTIGLTPIETLHADLVWEHFSEDDDRMRTAKQLCKTDPSPTEIGGFPIPGLVSDSGGTNALTGGPGFFSQGCRPTSLYSSDAFEVPNGDSFSYVAALRSIGPRFADIDPYASTTQSRNLRIIQSTIDPIYKAKNDTIELNGSYKLAPDLTFWSQTGFNRDSLYSAEDYNRFNTSPNVFLSLGPTDTLIVAPFGNEPNGGRAGYFCDPQIGCSNRLVAEDLSTEHAWQISHEIRLTSDFSGRFNFSVGANYLHYETEENYYVFINALTLFAAGGAESFYSPSYPWIAGVSDNHQCLINGFQFADPNRQRDPAFSCKYIDPNPISSLNDNGHNYFLSQNPYTLNSSSVFGESYFDLTKEIKLTGGLRFTNDRKHFTTIPSQVLLSDWGYPITGTIDQSWGEVTGRAAINWTPKIQFTDQSLLYGSFAHGYKAGGANPPGAVLLLYSVGDIATPSHPLTFQPEFIDAFELGTKNTMLDGALTLNGNVFFYNYKNYQISEIVDRTAINSNFDATVRGAELESTWEPMPGLQFNFSGGYESTRLANGSKAVDLMDRTAGHAGWIVMKPDITQASNCVIPIYVALARGSCSGYAQGVDPVTNLPYVPYPTKAKSQNGTVGPFGDGTYPGFDVLDPNAPNNGAGPVPNNGTGFDKDLSGNKLPNAPPFTVSVGAQYTIPLSSDWAGTLRTDYYWQDYSWARVFNDDPYDRLRGYTNVNLTLILTSQSGWQVMLYDKNVFNTTDVTGAFLNSDDSGLTTNVFLTDPKLLGIRVTKNW